MISSGARHNSSHIRLAVLLLFLPPHTSASKHNLVGRMKHGLGAGLSRYGDLETTLFPTSMVNPN